MDQIYTQIREIEPLQEEENDEIAVDNDVSQPNQDTYIQSSLSSLRQVAESGIMQVTDVKR